MGIFLVFLLCLLSGFTVGAEGQTPTANYAVEMASKRPDCVQQNSFLFTCGDQKQIARILELIDVIQKNPQGHKAWADISMSGHSLMIGHSRAALLSAGRTSAPLTSALSNGTGTSVRILMNFNIPDEGSHRVGGTEEEWTSFTAEQNFYHELAHAHHKMTGIFMGYRAEQQATEDENIYRGQQIPFDSNLRSLDIEKGEQIWFDQSR